MNHFEGGKYKSNKSFIQNFTVPRKFEIFDNEKILCAYENTKDLQDLLTKEGEVAAVRF